MRLLSSSKVDNKVANFHPINVSKVTNNTYLYVRMTVRHGQALLTRCSN